MAIISIFVAAVPGSQGVTGHSRFVLKRVLGTDFRIEDVGKNRNLERWLHHQCSLEALQNLAKQRKESKERSVR
jgi:hypothetical protein